MKLLLCRFIINCYCDIECDEINVNIESDINNELSREAGIDGDIERVFVR